MNVVDMVAIAPFYLELGLAMFGIDVASLSDIKGLLKVMAVSQCRLCTTSLMMNDRGQ